MAAMNPDARDELLPECLPEEPMSLLSAWLAEAARRALQPNPNAMVLATATPDGRPSARVVLCKEVAAAEGYVVFYTNYESHKGRELSANPRAAAVIHADQLHRQIRIEGIVCRAPPAQSDAYFASRPWQSRIGAWASAQSRPIASHRQLIEQVSATAQRLGVPDPATHAERLDLKIARPPHWGGFQLWADAIELWSEGSARVHERARWVRTLMPRAPAGFTGGPWSATRLQP